jgi:hypothetical protein
VAFGGGAYYFTIYSLRDWVEVPGTVTTFESQTTTESDGRTVTRFCPHVEYTTLAGETHDVLINECSSPRAYEAGEGVTVLYNPAAPEVAQLKGGIRDIMGNVFGIGFGVLGCIPLVLGLILAVAAIANAARRSKPRGPTGPMEPVVV